MLLAQLLGFWALVAEHARDPERRRRLLGRGLGEWALDLVNLGVQGTLVPLGGAWLTAALWARVLPGGWLPLGWVGGFVLNVVGVDYLYYWNHRLLHRWWPVHRVHHSAPAMDVFVTSRNTVWATGLIVYLWVNGLFVHLLDDGRGFLFGAGLTALLDLWRHSTWELPVPGLVRPSDHAWHHSADRHDVNFGANWTWWDRLHGTFWRPGEAPRRLGEPVPLPLWRQLLWPFGAAAPGAA